MNKVSIADQISTAITMSFMENMALKAPELEKRLLEGKIEKLELIPITIDGKSHLKCVADEIEFTFPLKPLFLKKLEEQKNSLVDEVKEDRRDEMDKSI